MQIISVNSTFEVAGTAFEIRNTVPGFENLIKERYLPFDDVSSPVSFSLEVELTDSVEKQIHFPLIRRFGAEAPYLWLFGRDGEFQIGFSNRESRTDSIIDDDRLYISSFLPQSEKDCCLNNAVMFRFTQESSFRHSLVTHSSAVVYNGKGYIFLGKSGTGKSTHSRLWLENIEGVELLNDDNPVILLENGIPWICGTPWSGKTPCYKNRRVPLGGIVRLKQAPRNQIAKLGVVEALGSLISSCSNVSWNENSRELTLQTIGQVVAQCPCWEMGCLPDVEAAYMSCKAITAE